MVDANAAAPLVVKDLQGGVVGQTGTVWTIAADGTFTVARQIGTRLAAPHKQGRLDGEQAARLRSMMEQPAMAALPAQLGEAPHPNARQISVTCCTASTVLTLSGGAGQTTLRNDQHSAQVLDLLDLIVAIIGR